MKFKTVQGVTRFFVLWSLAICFYNGLSPEGYAQEAGERKYGVIHNIAEDRQVERIGGIYEPEGLDKYMKRHFEAILSELQAVQNRLTDVEAALNEMRETLKNAPGAETLVS